MLIILMPGCWCSPLIFAVCFTQGSGSPSPSLRGTSFWARDFPRVPVFSHFSETARLSGGAREFQRTRIQSSDLPLEVWGQETVANPIRSEVEWDTKSSNLNSFSTVGYEVYWKRWNSRPPRAHPKTTLTPPPQIQP